MFIQSFKATIAFGMLAIVGILTYGAVVGPSWYIKAAVVLAVMSYLTQAVSTIEAQLLDQAGVQRVFSDDREDATRASAAAWNRAAQVMWLATLLVGLVVVASMVLS